jgi:hypothetical protein
MVAMKRWWKYTLPTFPPLHLDGFHRLPNSDNTVMFNMAGRVIE